MQSTVHIAPKAIETPSCNIVVDQGIIIVTVLRFWNLDDTSRYWKDLASLLTASRASHKGGRVLIDKRGSPVHSSEVVAALQRGFEQVYGAADRVAIVVDTSLGKMQARRLYAEEQMKAFICYDAALMWIKNV